MGGNSDSWLPPRGWCILEMSPVEKFLTTQMDRTFPGPPNSCAAKLQGTDSWTHAPHLERAPALGWSAERISDLRLKWHQDEDEKNPAVGTDSFPKSGPGQWHLSGSFSSLLPYGTGASPCACPNWLIRLAPKKLKCSLKKKPPFRISNGKAHLIH